MPAAFHFAGVSTKNATLGVPRLTEIINVAKNIKTPSAEVFLEPWAASDKLRAKQVQSTLEMCNLKRIVDAVEVHYDPDPLSTNIEADQELMEVYNIMPDEDQEIMALASPWLLRLIINRDMLVDKGISHLQFLLIIVQTVHFCHSSVDS